MSTKEIHAEAANGKTDSLGGGKDTQNKGNNLS